MNKPNVDIVTAFEICIDMLDRVEGTALYNITKEYYGYGDKDYQASLEIMMGIYDYLIERRKKE
jgi:hypothetical protein